MSDEALGLLWQDAESVLPSGWLLSLEYDSMTYRAQARESGPLSEVGISIAAVYVDELTPGAALRALIKKLRAERKA